MPVAKCIQIGYKVFFYLVLPFISCVNICPQRQNDKWSSKVYIPLFFNASFCLIQRQWLLAPLVIIVHESLILNVQKILESQKTCSSWRFFNFSVASFITQYKSGTYAHLSQKHKQLLIIEEATHHHKNQESSVYIKIYLFIFFFLVK